jgi:hypothetical protein
VIFSDFRIIFSKLFFFVEKAEIAELNLWIYTKRSQIPCCKRKNDKAYILKKQILVCLYLQTDGACHQGEHLLGVILVTGTTII